MKTLSFTDKACIGALFATPILELVMKDVIALLN